MFTLFSCHSSDSFSYYSIKKSICPYSSIFSVIYKNGNFKRQNTLNKIHETQKLIVYATLIQVFIGSSQAFIGIFCLLTLLSQIKTFKSGYSATPSDLLASVLISVMAQNLSSTINEVNSM